MPARRHRSGVPLPPEVDAVRDELARLYQAAQRSIDARLANLVTDPATAQRRAALRRQLVDLSREVTGLAADLDGAARDWASTRMPEIYGLGADTAAGDVGNSFGWAQADVAAVRELAADTYGDLLKATRFMRRDVKVLIREASRGQARVALLEGTTARRAGEQLARQLRDRGVNAVRYSNGALHTIGDYSDVVLWSKTAEAYNRGTLNALGAAGVTVVEVFDGPDCGWVAHDDSDKANGTLRALADAAAHTIAHPRCGRSFGGRPDLAAPPDGTRRFTPQEQQRLARQEAARARAQANQRARTRRRARARSG